MKKFLVLLLALALVVSLVACGEKKKDKDDDDDEETSETATGTEGTEGTEPVKDTEEPTEEDTEEPTEDTGDVKSVSYEELTMDIGADMDEFDFISYDVAYTDAADTKIVTVTRMDIASLELDDSMTVVEFGELFLTMMPSEYEYTDVDDYDSYSMSSFSADGTTSFVTFHKSADAYWVIQYLCEDDNVETYASDFQSWAESVEFND